MIRTLVYKGGHYEIDDEYLIDLKRESYRKGYNEGYRDRDKELEDLPNVVNIATHIKEM